MWSVVGCVLCCVLCVVLCVVGCVLCAVCYVLCAVFSPPIPRLSLSPPLSIGLQHNTLAGPLPSSLGLLTSLQELVLHDNAINGSLPLPLFQGLASSLLVLRLDSNEITGM